jgi:hypothetical protein
MKRSAIFLLIILALVFQGCAASKLTTRIGIQVGKGFLASADLGIPEMKRLVKAWPYVSGQIKAIPHYEEVVPPASLNTIKRLDKMAAKETLTDEECGTVSVDLVQIEYNAIQFGWDRYGVTITGWAKAAMGM